MNPNPVFFESPQAFREWLEEFGETSQELLVGYYRKSTGVPSLTWEESVDEALCFGWIDGIRRRVDEERYSIRFTPRRPRSHWSARNLERVDVLIRENRMRAAGLNALEANLNREGGAYSYEREHCELRKEFVEKLKSDPAAWSFFAALPKSVQRPSIWWVESAKKSETASRRFERLFECCARGERLPQFDVVKIRNKK